jgi:hypothetical protein
MAMVVTVTTNQIEGVKRRIYGTLAMDNAYPTGGLAFPLTSIGASRVAPKVLAHQDATPAAAAALGQVANAADLSSHTAVPFSVLVDY